VYASIALGVVCRARGIRVASTLSAGATVFLLAALHLGPPPAPVRGILELTVPDVGQGQSVLIRGGGGRTVLIDAGPDHGGRFDTGERVVAPFLAGLGCRRIDVLVLTHVHSDHAGGAASILRQFEVGEVWLGPAALASPRGRYLATLAREQGSAVVIAKAGETSSSGGVRLEIVHPAVTDLDLPPNGRSLVVRVSSGRGSILIPGDLESDGERRLLRRQTDAGADVLVVGHHGARTSTTEDFLRAVGPELGVIAAGRLNRFGHPDPGVLDRLRRHGVTILRTDRHGLVRLVCDGSGWRGPDLFDNRQGDRHER
jgi:competence protein ComEC